MIKNKYWLFRIAINDAKARFGRLMVFALTLIAGISALVAIESLKVNVSNAIDSEAKTLLAADFVFLSNQPFEDSVLFFLNSLESEQSIEIGFLSMAQFSSEKGTRLCNVKAVDENFPLYGDFETSPENAVFEYRNKAGAIIDKTLSLQFGLETGDSIFIGNKAFEISGVLMKSSDGSGFTSAFAPSVYIPFHLVEKTKLIQRGSRVTYKKYLKTKELVKLESMIAENSKLLSNNGIRTQSLAERKQQSGKIFESISVFLNLSGFIALLLGSIGVGSAVSVYINEKIADSAILRCLGVNQWDILKIYVFQVALIGLIGGILGAFMGVVFQFGIPWLAGSFLPFAFENKIIWTAVFKGLGIGFFTAIIFSFMPFIRLQHVSPMMVIQSVAVKIPRSQRYIEILFFALVMIYFFGLLYLQIGNLVLAFVYLLSVAVTIAFLWVIAQVLISGLKILKERIGFLPFRLAISNLSRPGNQTQVLLISLGFATTLIFTLMFIQNIILNEVKVSGSDGEPNAILFDIREDQLEEVRQFIDKETFEIIQEVPIVAMRIHRINDRSIFDLKNDSAIEVSNRTLEREFRVSFRDTLLDNERIVNGSWQGVYNEEDEEPTISLEESTAKSLGVVVGDRITFNVQGLPITTRVGSIRRLNFNRIQTNFTVLFPIGVLENAPKSMVIVGRNQNMSDAAFFQRSMVNQFPNISIIDLELILETLRDLSNKIGIIVQFMSFFSVVTGLIILFTSLINTKYQRIHDNFLLRTLGASKKVLVQTNLIEYLLFGFIATVSALLFALIASFMLNYFLLQGSYSLSFALILAMVLVTISVIALFAILVNRGIYDQSPMKLLSA